MANASYKPREGQLLPSPELREHFLEFYKGVKPKQIRMSGELFTAVDSFIARAHECDTIDEEEHRKILLDMVIGFRKALDGRDKVVKKRRYETGYSTKNFQIHLNQATYPVPHLPWAGITMTTLDIGTPGTANQVVRFVSWDVVFNGGTDERIMRFYLKNVDRSIGHEKPYSEALVDMIFEMIQPPKSTNPTYSQLANSIRVA